MQNLRSQLATSSYTCRITIAIFFAFSLACDSSDTPTTRPTIKKSSTSFVAPTDPKKDSDANALSLNCNPDETDFEEYKLLLKDSVDPDSSLTEPEVDDESKRAAMGNSKKKFCTPSSFEWEGADGFKVGTVGQMNMLRFDFEIETTDKEREIRFFILVDGYEMNQANQWIKGKAFYAEWAPLSKDVGPHDLQVIARDFSLCEQVAKQDDGVDFEECESPELFSEDDHPGVDKVYETRYNVQPTNDQVVVQAGDLMKRLGCKEERAADNSVADEARIKALEGFGGSFQNGFSGSSLKAAAPAAGLLIGSLIGAKKKKPTKLGLGDCFDALSN